MDAIVGALVGDAAGAILEFTNVDITAAVAQRAMEMPGGGKLNVGPGQITDDGELTLALWNALREHRAESGFPASNVANAYRKWYYSCPFDVGRTCSLAFDYRDLRLDLEKYRENVNCFNTMSESNGALMRATAIATWVAKSTVDSVVGAQYAMKDAQLSHPNKICQDVNAIYVFAVINLLRGIAPAEVIKRINEFIEVNHVSPKVREWYFRESHDITDMNAKQQIGHCRWGFVCAMYFLRHPEISYEDAIRTTLMKGGDTDTNAAIVGGIVGAYQTIPSYMLHPVLRFDCVDPVPSGHSRPSEYGIKYLSKGTLLT